MILDHIKIWTWRIVTVFLIIAVIFASFNADWFTVFLTAFVLILIYLPLLGERKYQIDFPSSLELIFIFFVYSSIYLGEVQYFYDKFWWWDLSLHGLSGLMLGAFGFLLVAYLHRHTRIIKKLNPYFIALFAFCFAVTLGVIWEILEFTIDASFGFRMQKTGLVDTMWDLIVNTMGALVISLGSLYYFGDKNNLLEKFLIKIVKK